jgi:hypothetical protein
MTPSQSVEIVTTAPVATHAAAMVSSKIDLNICFSRAQLWE